MPPSSSDNSPGYYNIRLNNYFQQKGKSISSLGWEEICIESGPRSSIWNVKCKVDGKVISEADAGTKKAAKNQAAQKALEALGIPLEGDF